MPVHPRSTLTRALLDRRSGDDADVDVEEEERFRQWVAASDGVARQHKDASGWEEPPRSVLRRLRRRRG